MPVFLEIKINFSSIVFKINPKTGLRTMIIIFYIFMFKN